MPKKKKTASEMTTEEIAKRVFPKKIREELFRLAHEDDEKEDSKTDDSS